LKVVESQSSRKKRLKMKEHADDDDADDEVDALYSREAEMCGN